MSIKIYDENTEIFEWDVFLEASTKECRVVNDPIYCFVSVKLFQFLTRNSNEIDVYTKYEIYNNMDIISSISNLEKHLSEIRGSLFSVPFPNYASLVEFSSYNIKFFPESTKNKIIENNSLKSIYNTCFTFSTTSKKVYADYKLCVQ